MDSKQSPPPEAKPVTKKRRAHAPSAYNLFVKAHYDSVRSMKRPQDRLKELGRLWQEHKKKGGGKKIAPASPQQK